MDRRAFLAISGSTLVAGCSEAEELSKSLSGENELGDSAEFNDIEVTVTDHMTAEQFTFNQEEIVSPGNAIYALFYVEVYNSDVTERKVPVVNNENYDALEEQEGTIHLVGINDIRVYGDGDGGHFPDVDWRQEYGWEEDEDGTLVRTGNIDFSVNGEELDPYPVGTTRPRIDPDTTISGWVIGVIERETTPKVRIQYDDNSATWEQTTD